jgi:hypothetical protein
MTTVMIASVLVEQPLHPVNVDLAFGLAVIVALLLGA